MWLWVLITFIFGGIAVLQIMRLADERVAERTWNLLSSTSKEPRSFSEQMVADLPEPARRYFQFSIAEGTPLYKVVELDMTGQLSLGSKDQPNYMPMRATQILAPALGFVWRPRFGAGPMRISGSDSYHEGYGWTRFWLWSLFPVARAGGSADFAHSAAARGIAEAVFWLPTALLPGKDVRWDAVDANTARVIVAHRGESYAVDITVAADGQPVSTVFQRWTRENPARVWRYQPFGATVEAITRFGGLRVASHVQAGNNFGTPSYFPFYIATVTSARYR
jgi:hypothetical protein